MDELYEYECDIYSDGRPERVVCQGRKEFIEKFIQQKEFDALFGGFILSGNIETGEEFIGVWRRRKCRRLRRILRERGAQFVLIKDVPGFRRIETRADKIEESGRGE
ncbi:MAG: hypothetical protein M3384_03420 [Acidobacteriota bacterium]|nr:hypothetical protein [Acidobacteriota bacterium]